MGLEEKEFGPRKKEGRRFIVQIHEDVKVAIHFSNPLIGRTIWNF